MLSILIPTYNYDCTKLIGDIDRQCRAMKSANASDGFNYEIIVADDASTNQVLAEKNRLCVESIGMRYEKMPKNVGRAKIRNRLVDMARYDYCIIMDCDAGVCSDDFIRRYWDNRGTAGVICGTLRNPPGTAPEGCELRYRYEHAAEQSRALQRRLSRPYERFTTFNFFFHRDVFKKVRFDERCIEYGYEDTLLGLMLKSNGISITHLDNPLCHNGIDSNTSFIEKTEKSMRSLRRLPGPLHAVAGASRIERLLKRVGMKWAVRLLFPLLKKGIRRNLLGHSPSLFLFKIYKAGFYICETKPQ